LNQSTFARDPREGAETSGHDRLSGKSIRYLAGIIQVDAAQQRGPGAPLGSESSLTPPRMAFISLISAVRLVPSKRAILLQRGDRGSSSGLSRYRVRVAIKSTVDSRTRFEGDDIELDLHDFLDSQLPPLLEANGPEAAGSAALLGLEPLTLDVDGEVFTLEPRVDRIEVLRTSGNGTAVRLDRAAFSDLVQDVVSTFGVCMLGRADITQGDVDSFVEWEPVLRSLIDGRSAYRPGSITFKDREGRPLELQQSFTLQDDPDEVGHFLAQAGYLHVQRVFTESEMASVSAELDEAIAAAERDDGASWWAQTDAGEWYPARMLGFNLKSPSLRDLLGSDRFAAVMTFTNDEFSQQDPASGDMAEGLLKKVGVVEGISDVSWHKDCAMGGHSRHCCGLTVGISITDATPDNGELGVVAGSHRANIPVLGTEGLDLPKLPLPTQRGDITVHCSCTLHMSRPPISAERRVVYSGVSLAPRAGDHAADHDADERRRERAALNEQTGHAGSGSKRVSSYEL